MLKGDITVPGRAWLFLTLPNTLIFWSGEAKASAARSIWEAALTRSVATGVIDFREEWGLGHLTSGQARLRLGDRKSQPEGL